jgi:adenosine deaminase
MVPGFAQHPLPMWLRRGLLVTINTDDPGISAIDLPHEYRVLREEFHLNERELRQLQANGVRAAFQSPAERHALWQRKQLGTESNP